jgi:hypothetical protein
MATEVRRPFPSPTSLLGPSPLLAFSLGPVGPICRCCRRPPPPSPSLLPSPPSSSSSATSPSLSPDFRARVTLVSSKTYLPAHRGSGSAGCGGSEWCPHRGCHGSLGEPPWTWATSRCPPLFTPSPHISFPYRRRGRARR